MIRRPLVLSNDRGSGSILALAILGVIIMAMAGLMPLIAVISGRRVVAAAADASALAGAAVAEGFVPGSVCEVARDLAIANKVILVDCAVTAGIVTVSAEQSFLGFVVVGRATAGPSLQR